MKLNLKILLIFLVTLSVKINAQNNRCYNYDAAGNRIARIFCTSSIILDKEDEVSHKQIVNIGLQKRQIENRDYNLIIAPNPAASHIEIILKGFTINATWYILNEIGIEILKGKADAASLDISTLPSGTYFIKLVEDEKKITKHFIKID